MITPHEWQAFLAVVNRAPMTPLEVPTVQRIADELAQLLQGAQQAQTTAPEGVPPPE